jgi:hypothetical protein
VRFVDEVYIGWEITLIREDGHEHTYYEPGDDVLAIHKRMKGIARVMGANRFKMRSVLGNDRGYGLAQMQGGWHRASN